jgi:membrane protein implicated in regulation of membrane protease activity
MVVLLGTVFVSLVLDFLFRDPLYGKFWWDGLHGFSLIFGLVGFAVIVLVSKVLGKRFVQREEQYYDKR